MKTIIILNYGIGNVRSIYNALMKVNVKPVLSNDPSLIASADGVILPGVGAFAKGMSNLNSHHLVDPIKSFVKSGKPFLGICLGMQMLLEESEEFGITKGLGLIPGKVRRLKVNGKRLPHVSWNELKPRFENQWKSTVLSGVPATANVYFVHSFAACPTQKEHVLATTNYDGFDYCSAVYNDNVTGVQFHPEKSAMIGLQILQNFINE